jgi:hypothetical protein
MIKHISESTLIPMGFAVLVIGTGTMWITDMTSQVKQHKEILDEMRKSEETGQKLIYEINSRLSRIEWRLETKNGGK